jgi:hypothetical protein
MEVERGRREVVVVVVDGDLEQSFALALVSDDFDISILKISSIVEPKSLWNLGNSPT